MPAVALGSPMAVAGSPMAIAGSLTGVPGTVTDELTARQRNGRRALVLSTDPIGPEMPAQPFAPGTWPRSWASTWRWSWPARWGSRGRTPMPSSAWRKVPLWPNWSMALMFCSPPAPWFIWPESYAKRKSRWSSTSMTPPTSKTWRWVATTSKRTTGPWPARPGSSTWPCSAAIFSPVPASAKGTSGSGHCRPWAASTPTTMRPTISSKSSFRSCPTGCPANRHVARPTACVAPFPGSAHSTRWCCGAGECTTGWTRSRSCGRSTACGTGWRTYAWCSSGFATPTRPSRRWRWPRSCRPCRTSSG